MPDAAQAVDRYPLDLSWCRDSHQFWRRLYVFDTSSDGSLALVSLIHNWSRLAGPFPQRSPPWLLTTAAWGALKPAPASRLRGTYPHLLYSLVAHYLQHISTFESLKKLWYSFYISISNGRSFCIKIPCRLNLTKLLSLWASMKFYRIISFFQIIWLSITISAKSLLFVYIRCAWFFPSTKSNTLSYFPPRLNSPISPFW